MNSPNLGISLCQSLHHHVGCGHIRGGPINNLFEVLAWGLLEGGLIGGGGQFEDLWYVYIYVNNHVLYITTNLSTLQNS